MADHAGELFAVFVKEQLEQEDKRRAALESRGAGVITLSSTLVTLLFGISAVATKNAAFTAPGEVKQRLGWALVAFAVSSIIAIGTTVPLATRIVDAKQLGSELQQRWNDTVDAARKTIIGTQVDDLANAQRINTIKSVVLMVAIAAQVSAVLLLAWSVYGLLR